PCNVSSIEMTLDGVVGIHFNNLWAEQTSKEIKSPILAALILILSGTFFFGHLLKGDIIHNKKISLYFHTLQYITSILSDKNEIFIHISLEITLNCFL
ncbi:hypothetical protein ACJX0J_030015, partial [Zea mays]